MGNLAIVLLEERKDADALEEPVTLLTEELRVRVSSLGKGCLALLPQLTSVLLRRIWDALFALPNLGADVEGYEALMMCVQEVVGSASASGRAIRTTSRSQSS